VIGIGLIGCGLMGQLHASALGVLESSGMPIRPVAAADPEPAARLAAQRNWRFADLHENASAVFDEASSIASGLASGLICQVGFQLRRLALVAEAHRVITSGELGPPMAYVLRDDQAFPMTSVDRNISAWRSQREHAGGGTLIEHSIHGIDLLNWIFGRPVAVTARTRSMLGLDVEDTATALIDHESGVSGTLVSVYGLVRGREESRLEVFCRDEVIEITWGSLVEAPENSIRVQRSGEPPEDLDPTLLLDQQLHGLGLSQRPFLLNELADRAFVEAVLSGRPATPDLGDALVAHGVVEAAYRSAESGSRVAVPHGTGTRSPEVRCGNE
jgi:predicted dehydrogenase